MRPTMVSIGLTSLLLSAPTARANGSSATADKLSRSFSLAQGQWSRTCRAPRKPDGACLAPVLPPRPGKQPRLHNARAKRCGPAVRLQRVGRRSTAQATRAIAKVLKSYQARYPSPSTVPEQASAAYAGALFLSTQAEFERFFTEQFPARLDFNPSAPARAKQSRKRFDAYVKTMKSRLAALRKSLRAVHRVRTKERRWAAVASYQLGQLSHYFAASLITAPIPIDVRTGRYAEDKIRAYCGELNHVARPLYDMSHQAYEHCRKLAPSAPTKNLCARLANITAIKP